MKLEEFKSQIENNKNIENIIICQVYNSINSDFLFDQYLKEYSINNNLSINYIDSFDELPNSSLFSSNSNIIYVYNLKKLEKNIPNTNDKLWIKCSSIDKKVKTNYENNIVLFPKLEDWQIKDYIYSNTKNLNTEYINKLYNHYHSNLYRLSLEIDKLNSFGDNDSNDIYKSIEDQLYVDSSEYSIFDLTNCIIKKDIKSLLKLKNSIDYIDIDPFGLLKIFIL